MERNAWNGNIWSVGFFILLGVIVGISPVSAMSPDASPLDGADLSRLSPKLQTELAGAAPDGRIPCIVEMNEGYPHALMRVRGVAERIDTYRTISERSQRSVMSLLESRRAEAEVVQQYWVFNGFFIKATPDVIAELSNRDDVRFVHHNGTVSIFATPAQEEPEVGNRTLEWNVQKVSADLCWDQGVTGGGVIVGHTDTGVDASHPSLVGKWTGYWYDSINHRETPYDDHGHGTHTMGTIVGGDGYGPFSEDIGVAPGATYVTAKILDGSGSGTFDQIIEGLQWMGDLKATVDMRMMSASWRSTDLTNTFFWSLMETYNAIGILPVIANGNEGPGPATAAVPGNYSVCMGVGAINSSDGMASFSSRGPAPSIAPWSDESTWYRPDWNFIKPDITAPGESVRSCFPGGGYETWNGTSMATPHVAGGVALLCQKNPLLTTQMIYNILLDNADQPSQGAPYPNNEYGWGRMNIFNALQATPSPDQPWVIVADKSLADPPPYGNGNGSLDPGETVAMTIEVVNLGTQAHDVEVTFVSRDNYVTVDNGYHFFGDLEQDETGTNAESPFSLHVHELAPQGHMSQFGLTLRAQGDDEGFESSVTYTYQIGTPPPPITLFEDDFEYGDGGSFWQNWIVEAGWSRIAQQAHSPWYSAYNGGAASVETQFLTLMSPIDLSSYPHANLEFWHKYWFDQAVFTNAVLDFSIDGGESWQGEWNFSFINDDNPLLEWESKTFSLSNHASEWFRFRFEIRADPMFNNWASWWIDDIKITSPVDVEPPYFADTTDWADASEPGPFLVESTVTDTGSIEAVLLRYRVDGGPWTSVPMSAGEGDLYQALIPAQPLNSTIDYYLWARDEWVDPNEGSDPVGAPDDGTYSFMILDAQQIDDDGDGYNEYDGDCDDTDPLVSPGEDEDCFDGVDNDCDGFVDLDDADNCSPEMIDDDGDGFNELEGDCDDTEPEVHPEAMEDCEDGIDNDCNGSIDTDLDDDGDGYWICGDPADCDDGDPLVHPDAQEACDGVDNNCDGTVDEGDDMDGDGFSTCAQPLPDCDDNDPYIHPQADEDCDNYVDDDCDGLIDLNDMDCDTVCRDLDGDGYGDPSSAVCVFPQWDCDDTDPYTNPGAQENCADGVDNDCDGMADDVDPDCGITCFLAAV